MTLRVGEKFKGYEIERREKFAPSRTALPANTVEGKKRITQTAQKVIRVHKDALVALRDR